MNEDIHFERRGGELIRSFATGPPRKGARATAAAMQRCTLLWPWHGARLGMAVAALAIHPSPSIRSFLHDDGDEAADHDEALEEVRPHHRPQTALQRKPQK